MTKGLSAEEQAILDGLLKKREQTASQLQREVDNIGRVPHSEKRIQLSARGVTADTSIMNPEEVKIGKMMEARQLAEARAGHFTFGIFGAWGCVYDPEGIRNEVQRFYEQGKITASERQRAMKNIGKMQLVGAGCKP